VKELGKSGKSFLSRNWLNELTESIKSNGEERVVSSIGLIRFIGWLVSLVGEDLQIVPFGSNEILPFAPLMLNDLREALESRGGGGRVVETAFLDFVEKGLVADGKKLCRHLAIPVGLLQCFLNHLSFGLNGGSPADLLE